MPWLLNETESFTHTIYYKKIGGVFMPRFFTGNVQNGQAEITGNDARHMALSLRMKIGDPVTICNNDGTDYQCVITAIHPEQVILSVQDCLPSAGEPSVFITLYQALPKGDKLEMIVQKAVELGVGRIVPVLTHRCVSRPDAKAMAKKLERCNRIALEAAKQCGRGHVPSVEPVISFAQALEQMAASSLALFFYENGEQSLRSFLSEKHFTESSVLIGSEGGFEVSEARQAADAGLVPLSLGNRILRCETAPLAAITSILYEAGDL